MAEHNPYQPPDSKTENLNLGQGEETKSDVWQSQGNLVVLATFDNGPEAHALRIELENNGIRAAVANESSAQSIGGSLFGRLSAVWIEVVVLDSDAEQALVIKNAFLAGINDSEITEWQCKCGEMVDAGFAQCWSCMAPHPDAE